MAHKDRLNAATRAKLIALLPRLRRFALVLAGDLAGSDTLLRTACRKMIRKLHAFPQGTAFDLWAFGALHGQWLERLRSHEAPISQVQADASAFKPATEHESGEHDGEIAAILSRLPPQQRSAILLLYGEGFSYDEAAQILDTSPQTVLARASRALAMFIERADWLDGTGQAVAQVEQLKQINRQAG